MLLRSFSWSCNACPKSCINASSSATPVARDVRHQIVRRAGARQALHNAVPPACHHEREPVGGRGTPRRQPPSRLGDEDRGRAQQGAPRPRPHGGPQTEDHREQGSTDSHNSPPKTLLARAAPRASGVGEGFATHHEHVMRAGAHRHAHAHAQHEIKHPPQRDPRRVG